MNELLNLLQPHDKYLTPDDNFIYEWQLPNEVIVRVELCPDNNIQIMISYPEQPATFINLKEMP